MYIKGNILIMQIEVLQTFLVSSQFWPNEDSILVQSTLTKYMVTEVQRYTELKVNKRSLV